MRYVRKYNVHPWCDNAPSFSYQRCSVSITILQRFNVDTVVFVFQRYSVSAFFMVHKLFVKTWVMAEISKNIVLVSEVVNKKV